MDRTGIARAKFALVGVFALCSGIVFQPGSAQAAFPGGNGKIAAADGEYGGGALSINSFDPLTGNRSLLFTNFEVTGGGSWSAGGGRLAIPVAEPDRFDRDIATVDAQGNNLDFVTGTAADEFDPAWSPDGRKIVFAATGSALSRYGLHVVDVATGQVTRLTTNADDNSPSWSPDGSKIVFARTVLNASSLEHDIYTYELAGGAVRKITSDGDSYDPDWSPDGKQIAFVSRTGASSLEAKVTVMSPVGGNRRRLTNENTGMNADPSWSPSGNCIVFSAGRHSLIEPHGLSIVSADGSRLRRLSPAGSYRHEQREADWQPTSGTSDAGCGLQSQALLGRKLALTSSTATKTLRILSRDDAITFDDRLDDPTLSGGELSLSGNGLNRSYGLPASGWSATGTGFKYSSTTGAIRTVKLVKHAKLLISGRGSSLGYDLATNPTPLETRLSMGARVYCLKFAKSTGFNPGRSVRAGSQLALADC